jgi:hypothetical protein
MNNKNYNGWANRETWNVALYAQNDYELYQIARFCNDWRTFLKLSESIRSEKTPDGVSWIDENLNVGQLNTMIQGLT